MSETIHELMARLRREYLAEMPARLDGLREAMEAFLGGRDPPGPPLGTLFHRLSGSAGAYGFDAASALCRDTEQWLVTGPTPTAATRDRLEQVLADLERIFERGEDERAPSRP